MSELRDLTMVFRAIQVSLKDLGDHVASQDANGEQLRLSLHNLNNAVTRIEGTLDEHIEKSNAWMATFDREKQGLFDAMSSLQTSLADHRREIGQRIRKFEDRDEVTSPGRR